ncbi:MAG TPA: site-2 protease family protein [Chloroflexota bacterium]
MSRGTPLFRVGGIEVRADATWVVAVALITGTLALGQLPLAYPGWSRAAYWAAGAAAALLLFGSVLVHELAHAFVAISRGIPVKGITLFIFGGVAALGREPQRPRDEFLVAIVGPIASLALALVFWALAALTPNRTPPEALFAQLATINALLAGFNLLPGFPLDGGRVLRAAIWGATGSYRRATEVAALVGLGLAFILIMWGLLRALTGDLLGGLWTAFIGWFLQGAADASRREAAFQDAFRGLRVRQLMDDAPATTTPDTPIETLVYDELLMRGKRALPVCDGQRLLGIVSLTDVKHVPQDRWSTTTVGEIMTRSPLHTVGPLDEVARALRLMAEHEVHQLPVVEDGRLVGLLNRADLIRYLQFREELGIEGPGRGPRPTPSPEASG